MKKIAIFGGSFDPVHIGHTNLLNIYTKEFDFDKILVIPAKNPPHKNNAYIADEKQRLEMCKIAFAKNNTVEVSDIEYGMDGKSYTVNTLEKLEIFYPGSEFFLIIGSDMLISFTKWYKWKEILKKTCILSASRGRNERRELVLSAEHLRKYGGKVIILDIQEIEISSSEIRELIKSGEDVRKYLDNNVYDYIKKEGMYFSNENYPPKSEILKILRGKLNEKRYNHSLAVADMALTLAGIYGADPAKTETAALLHDVMKCEKEKILLQFIQDNGIILSDVELSNSSVWHSMAGFLYAKNVLGIKNEDVLNAVRYHTTGRYGMTLLERIIYMADLVSEDRDYPDVDKFRKLAFLDLDMAMYRGICYILGDLLEQDSPIHSDTIEAYEEFFEKAVRKAKQNKIKTNQNGECNNGVTGAY